jgi:hypothetical protein
VLISEEVITSREQPIVLYQKGRRNGVRLESHALP